LRVDDAGLFFAGVAVANEFHKAPGWLKGRGERKRTWPDAEDAKISQRTQKILKKIQIFFGFLLRPLRSFCVLCVRYSSSACILRVNK
jgi:hypothetical protein